MNTTKNKYKNCNHCKQRMMINAKICHMCGHHQNIFWNIIDKGGPLTAIIMVIIATVQVIIAFQQRLDTEAEHIKASDALKRSILAESYADTALKKTKDIYNNAKEETELFRKFLKNTTEDFKNKYAILSNEINKLQSKNDITLLGDSAISLGSKTSLIKLKRLSKESSKKEIKLYADSEILRVYSMHQSIAYVEPVLIDTLDGKIKKESDYNSAELIIILLNHSDWKKRASSARLLREKKEKGVPEALINAIKTDNSLFVIRWATESFEELTGYTAPDFFEMHNIDSWWKNNLHKYYKNIKN